MTTDRTCPACETALSAKTEVPYQCPYCETTICEVRL
jgi:predicted RNA-binding Zn-ribbon protein involved in translation (DUF1610 family)